MLYIVHLELPSSICNEQLNVSANESLFVGDHPVNDMKAAQNVGRKAIWKKDPQWSTVEADFIIHDLAELGLIINK
jgi:putative hydrolase of the HAD superfamily